MKGYAQNKFCIGKNINIKYKILHHFFYILNPTFIQFELVYTIRHHLKKYERVCLSGFDLTIDYYGSKRSMV